MKRLLLVIGLVAMFSLAASAKKTPSTTYNFQFLTTNGDPYCDGMFLNNYGNPKTLVDGFHFDVSCFQELGNPEFSQMSVNGFLAPVASNYQYGGSGNVMIVSDPALAFSSIFLGCPISYPAPDHSTSNVNCRPASLPYPGTVYLINPASNTWTLWVSGNLTGEYVVNYGTIQPTVGPLTKSPQLSNPTPSFAR